MSYAHLSQDERYQIQCYTRGRFSLRTIADELERHPSTISRELRRNASAQGGYERKHAQRQSVIRRRDASTQPRIDVAAWVIVEASLRDDWSPDQIAGDGDVAISHERIYQHIAATVIRAAHCGPICVAANADEDIAVAHPVSANALVDAAFTNGHRVSNSAFVLAIGRATRSSVKGSLAWSRVVDRKSGLGRIRQVPNGEADTVMRAIVGALHPLQARVHTLTWDNGSEFAEHDLIDIALTGQKLLRHAVLIMATRLQRELQWTVPPVHTQGL